MVNQARIRSFRDLGTETEALDFPVVTLFSGGLDSSYLLYRLHAIGSPEVHAVSVDIGDEETTDEKQRIADRFGVKLHIVDGRDQFAEEYLRPAIAAQSVYLGTHPISSSLSRPLIARIAMKVAEEIGARTLLHTANRSQNTLRRLNGALGLLGFPGNFGSPYELEPVDRDRKIEELDRAGLHGLSGRSVSIDSNLWCREFESGSLDDPEHHPVPEDLYRWTRSGRPAPSPETVRIGFRAGTPTEVNGRELPLAELITRLNHLVGAHGIGRFSGLEHLAQGEKVLEIREMPAAFLLMRTARHLETAVLEAETIREKMHMEQIWTREALEGRWFGELRRAGQSFIESCAARVTGEVTWRLSSGTAETCGILAESPRYIRSREAWERSCVESEVDGHRSPSGPVPIVH
ncbi:argininosuccinate synthase-related protein [Streptomyces sp. ML-6]|uniref:argininosuccinate synthase-related protein n=1 Tax=Streptomyces sp. ML-6 TaxID=2982693 RepID=UPI0024C001F2|nr:argininosuccinate synthase-related protein [Streptomyces sp. ML-6]MDK0517999.1 argininosuccinate synthase-related protein [Streptomyces sp. ML-6]